MKKEKELEVRERASQRAERALMAWRLRPAGQGPRHVARTPYGEVILEHVEARQDGDLTYLEVWVGGDTESGDPHFRVVNPPLLVRDPEGEVAAHGERWREDPLAALAEAVGSNGGAVRHQKRRHGR